MNSYGQYCPIARATEILGERWTLLILRDILDGSRRFNEIRKGVPRMSPTLLSTRLKSLEASGLIARRESPKSGAIEYLPTQAGLEVKPILELYGIWGQRWVRNRLGDDELDVGLLMWYLRWGIDATHFPSGRTVIGFEFTDRPRLKMGKWWADSWWIVVTNDAVDLCIKDPGLDVDIYVISDLSTFTKVSMGDISAPAAQKSNAIRVRGRRALEKTFSRWFPRSSFANVPRPAEPLDVRPIMEFLERCKSGDPGNGSACAKQE